MTIKTFDSELGTRQCILCKKIKPLEEYRITFRTYKDKTYHCVARQCDECYNKKRYKVWINGRKKERIERIRQKSRHKNKNKQKARDKFHYKLKQDKLIKSKNCIICGSNIDIQAHHEDYSKPLEVMWLCRKCHWKKHRKINRAELFREMGLE